MLHGATPSCLTPPTVRPPPPHKPPQAASRLLSSSTSSLINEPYEHCSAEQAFSVLKRPHRTSRCSVIVGFFFWGEENKKRVEGLRLGNWTWSRDGGLSLSVFSINIRLFLVHPLCICVCWSLLHTAHVCLFLSRWQSWMLSASFAYRR